MACLTHTVDVDLGRCGPQQGGPPGGDALKPSSPGLSMHSLSFVQTMASPGFAQLPYLLHSWLPRGTLALGLWGCYGKGVPPRAGVCRLLADMYETRASGNLNDTSLIPGPYVGLLELKRHGQHRSSGSLPEVRAQHLGVGAARPQLSRSPSPCQPIGSCLSIRTPLTRFAHIPAHVVLHCTPTPTPGLLSWRSSCSAHWDWAPQPLSILYAAGQNTDARWGYAANGLC